MPDHLSIEILGVLRGTADGPLAIATLGAVALAILAVTLRSFSLRKRASALGELPKRQLHGTARKKRGRCHDASAHRRRGRVML